MSGRRMLKLPEHKLRRREVWEVPRSYDDSRLVANSQQGDTVLCYLAVNNQPSYDIPVHLKLYHCIKKRYGLVKLGAIREEMEAMDMIPDLLQHQTKKPKKDNSKPVSFDRLVMDYSPAEMRTYEIQIDDAFSPDHFVCSLWSVRDRDMMIRRNIMVPRELSESFSGTEKRSVANMWLLKKAYLRFIENCFTKETQ